ncbi:unnamed protein product [Didymodactylos carnosus]|uniref:RNA helicase n=1 Tax=Didymodactylos carnosus TaxID=1234261 RepID=A0A814JCJ1_9BILA|nr:unnamed protein product [Didymodactylos carnosus]CAF1034974.1 unnamed protein product [Didymodactylos carnosus]CAF3604838.1 unnamed protein product [Didymodactylos carnosus]CAF3805652.1 unnamed protein product [Didymodactylos carnosus]
MFVGNHVGLVAGGGATSQSNTNNQRESGNETKTVNASNDGKQQQQTLSSFYHYGLPSKGDRFSFKNLTPSTASKVLPFDRSSNNHPQNSSLFNFDLFSSMNLNTDTSHYNNNSNNILNSNLFSPPQRSSQQVTKRYEFDDDNDDEKVEQPLDLAEIALLNKFPHLRDVDETFVQDDGTNPSSPLYSVKTFEELKLGQDLLNGIYNMGFRRPSRIQERALPQLLAYPPRNMIAQSQNGTGKTAAFSLATLSRINPNVKSVQALILAPTFELALQIGSVIEKMAKFLPYITIAYAVRDITISKRDQLVRNQLLEENIVIGTPGTVEDYCRKKRVIDLKKLKVFVVDEADVMISTADFKQICIDLVKKTIDKECQTMLFSATYSDEIMDFAKRVIENPVIFRLKREEQSLTNIRQYYIRCQDDDEKYDAIKTIYVNITVGQAMIFCRNKQSAYNLALKMKSEKHCVELLSSQLDVEQRAAVIKRFREGKFRVLVVTNVCARGIDIDDISLVVNYDMPLMYDMEKQRFINVPDYETYLHRIGRAGRFGRIGYTFNLIKTHEMELMKSIENYFQKPIPEFTEEGVQQDEVYGL